MFFNTNSDNDEIVEANDNSDNDESMETADNGEIIDYGDSADNGDDDGGGSSDFDFGRFLIIAFAVLFTAILAGYCVFSIHEAGRYKKLDAMEPHSRTYAEFAEVFNELMEPQDISIDVEPGWRPVVFIDEWRVAISIMTLPDGSLAPCGVKLWGSSVKNSHIMRFAVTFSKEQAAYMEPVVRGMYSVFTPEVNEQEYEDYAKIFRALPQAFERSPYEWEWYVCPDANFSMLADDSDYVTLLWRINSSGVLRRNGVLMLP